MSRKKGICVSLFMGETRIYCAILCRFSETEQTIPQSATLTAPFAQGSHWWAGAASHLPHASPYGKGRWRNAPEGIRVNPQKGRHLLCSFCPYEMRSMSRKGRELCPIGAKREGKPRFSGIAARTRLSLRYNLSAESSLLLFCPAKEKQRNGDVWGGVTK